MNDNPVYMIAFFKSVHHVLVAEKILKMEGIPYKLIPVPKIISMDCSICIRFYQKNTDDVERLLRESQGLLDIVELH